MPVLQLDAPGTPEVRDGGRAEEARAGGSVPVSVLVVMRRSIGCRWCGMSFSFCTLATPPFIDEEMKRVLDDHAGCCPKKRDGA